MRSRATLLPMQWVAADVHHIDVLVKRDDGTLCTPKAVAWQCLATNRLYMNVYVLPPGKMIARRHVVESFTAMAADPAWGVPETIYGDNGGEYAWLDEAADLAELARKARINGRLKVRDKADLDTGPALRRSRPYNPQAKAIEGIFGALEQGVLAQIPGHIGGERMSKKTQQQGREPEPFQGDEAALREALQTAVDYYHALPQQGHLADRSPAGAFAAHVDAGWKSVTLDPGQTELVFARLLNRIADRGTVSIEGRKWYGDALLSSTAERVHIRVPLAGDGSRVYAFADRDCREFLGALAHDPVFDWNSAAGAKEQRRRAAEYKRQRQERDALTAPRRDPLAIMREAADLAPAPHVEPLATVTVSGAYAAAAAAPEPVRRAAPEPAADPHAQVTAAMRALAEAGQ